jgi:hypothetical protein
MISVVAMKRKVPTEMDSKMAVQSGLIFWSRYPRQTEKRLIPPSRQR